MSYSTYPAGSARELLATEHVSEATRAALQARLDAPAEYVPRFFAAETFTLLEAIAARLLPQPERETPIPLAPEIDRRLANGDSDGWRYDALPPDREAFRLGLGAIKETALALFQVEFLHLSPANQDAVLQVVAAGNPPGSLWATVPAVRFFEELLAELTTIYYAHPLAQEEIGYVGMADLPGWTKIGLNEHENREPGANG